MTDPTVFRQYTRAELDAEYDNRAKVSESAVHIAWYTERSVATRAHLGFALDLSYGESHEETLDLFGVAGGGHKPVHIFFHGGYWRAMHKDDFSFVADGLAPHGALIAVVNYTLIPTVDMARLIDECRRSVLWLYHNVSAYGGDSDQMYVSGHSAGGHIAAMMMATDFAALDANVSNDIVKGACGISGLYDLEPIRQCFLNEVLGLDDVAVASFSPVLLEKHGNGPVELIHGDAEGDEFARQSNDLANVWDNTRAKPMAPFDHFSIMRELARDDSELTGQIVSMMGLD